MKLPRLSRRTWILIGVLVVAGLFLAFKTREHFQSKVQFEVFGTKLKAIQDTPEFKAIGSFPSVPRKPDGTPNHPAITMKFIGPLFAVGMYGDVVGDDLQVKQSQIESMLNGTFPVDTAITVENVCKMQVIIDGDRGVTMEKCRDELSRGLGKAFAIDLPKNSYYIYAKGQVPPGLAEKETNELRVALQDPNDKEAKQWTEQEKQWLRSMAGKIYKIIPDAPAAPSPTTPAAPSPSTPAASTVAASASGAYAATCTKCTVINNQLSCSCDVTPK